MEAFFEQNHIILNIILLANVWEKEKAEQKKKSFSYAETLFLLFLFFGKRTDLALQMPKENKTHSGLLIRNKL